VEANPCNGLVYLLKIDLAKRFYRISLCHLNIPKLGIAFSNLPHEPKLMAFPLTLPMGWKNSPPIFCMATETIAYIANYHIWHNKPTTPHHLESQAMTRPPTQPTTPPPLPHYHQLSLACPYPQHHNDPTITNIHLPMSTSTWMISWPLHKTTANNGYTCSNASCMLLTQYPDHWWPQMDHTKKNQSQSKNY